MLRSTAVHREPSFEASIRFLMSNAGSNHAFSVRFDVSFFFYAVFILGRTFDLLFSILAPKNKPTALSQCIFYWASYLYTANQDAG